MSVNLRCVSVMILVVAGLRYSAAKASSTAEATLNCTNIGITGPSDQSVVRLGDVAVKSYDDRSMSSITTQNVSDKSIESLLMLIEFVDPHGSRLETGLYYATTHRFSDELLQVQKGYGIQKLRHRLEPKEEVGLSPVNDIVLPKCPANGVVTKADVRFDDGSSWLELNLNVS